MNQRLLGAIRILLGVSWLYQGLWLKLVATAPSHLAVVEAVGPVAGMSPSTFLRVIGACETLLGLGVLSGIAARGLGWLQIVLVVAMNAVGIAAGGDSIADPVGLVVTNLPFVACALVVAVHGAGAWSLGARPTHGR